MPQYSPGHLWAKGKSAAPKQPGAILWRKGGQRQAGGPGKREFWLSERGEGQQNVKKIGEVR